MVPQRVEQLKALIAFAEGLVQFLSPIRSLQLPALSALEDLMTSLASTTTRNACGVSVYVYVYVCMYRST